MFQDDPLGIALMGRAQQRRAAWDLANPGQQGNPMGVAPHMASTDMLPEYLNEQEADATAHGLKYRTMPFGGNNLPLAGLKSATKRKR